MANDQRSYEALLADLEAQKAVIENAIAGVKYLMGQGLTPPEGASVGSATTSRSAAIPHDVRADTFLGQSLPDAILKYLRIARSKQSTAQIADALLRGGVETTSKNFRTMLATILRREAGTSDVLVKVKGGWGLAEWYGPHIRRQAAPKPKPAKRRGRPPKRAPNASEHARSHKQHPTPDAE